ncbi:CLUMA_CG018071, isoform A [Clunio marinus]|uniref:CLUMA_CG018071, isoform A n=1 Tax=Clunio marinus TaxID=568069 RepID=A0A1J1IXQ2_9DIPT|nr:CLUMA_CG018071, isoform A [Clunio marinus]
MKLIIIACGFIIATLTHFPLAISSSFTILNSVGHDCDSGECLEVCEYEDFKLMPGTADSNNSKCLAIFCSEDFTLTVHTCIHEEDPTCSYTHNYKKPFPDCCNQFCQSIIQLN